MPKELIYSPEAVQARDQNSTSAPYPVEHLAVGWTRDRDVQLGLAAGPGATIQIHTDNTGEQVDSLWLGLSRNEVNRLIQSLRKARDQAYGRDA